MNPGKELPIQADFKLNKLFMSSERTTWEFMERDNKEYNNYIKRLPRGTVVYFRINAPEYKVKQGDTFTIEGKRNGGVTLIIRKKLLRVNAWYLGCLAYDVTKKLLS